MIRFSLFAFLLLNSISSTAQTYYPEGFGAETLFKELEYPAGLLHGDSTRMFAWTLGGQVWLIHNGEIHPTPVIDIREEVGQWGDNGMIGATLDPNFQTNGYIYLYYTVDWHYLNYFGTPQYNPEETEVYNASMGRITRYTINTIDFQFAIPGSRKIILGESVGEGIPNACPTHCIGTLFFGEDGSLLVSTGDGNTWIGSTDSTGFNGTGPLPEFAFDDVAIARGILRPDENLGAFRAQYLDGLNGKILRIDPATGQGLPGNPFFIEGDPDAARSKVWSLGFRNPYRFTVKPGTGYGDLNKGFPGVIYISDVGDWLWEETNVVTEGGQNFGWPLYQGTDKHDFYYNVPTANTNAPNELSDGDSCPQYMNYQHTIVQASQIHNESFPNPCDIQLPINENIPTFIHTLPSFAHANWAQGWTLFAGVPRWNDDGTPFIANINDPNTGVKGQPFNGYSGCSGAFLHGDKIPQEYQGALMIGDYSGWLREFRFNDANDAESVTIWNENTGSPIHISQNPWDGCIYVVNLNPSDITRICYGANLNPIIIATPEMAYGSQHLSVTFDASESYDPEGDPLSFYWEFPNGNTSSSPIVEHTFTSPQTNPANFNVKLSVSDTSGGISIKNIPIYLNNTPPTVEITGIQDSTIFPMDEYSSHLLFAVGIDAESASNMLEYKWELFLHHNTHYHLMETFVGNNLITTLLPTGCPAHETYWYSFVVQVTDPQGMMSTDTVSLFPNCDGIPLTPIPFNVSNIYPNPTTDIVNIDITGKIKQDTYARVYDINGRKIIEETIPPISDLRRFQIDLSPFANGIYILRLDIEHQTMQRKIVKL